MNDIFMFRWDFMAAVWNYRLVFIHDKWREHPFRAFDFPVNNTKTHERTRVEARVTVRRESRVNILRGPENSHSTQHLFRYKNI